MAKVIRKPGVGKMYEVMDLLGELGEVTAYDVKQLTGWSSACCVGALNACHDIGWIYVKGWKQVHEHTKGRQSRVWAIGVGKRDAPMPDSKLLRAQSQRRYRDKIKVLWNRKLAVKKGKKIDHWVTLAGRMQ